MTTPRRNVTFSIHPEILERLALAAQAEGRSRSNLVERIILSALPAYEPCQVHADGQHRWKPLETGSDSAPTWVEDDAPIDLE